MEDFDEIAPDRAVVVMTVHQIGIVFPPALDNIVFGHIGERFVVVELAEGKERVGCGVKENGIVANSAVVVFADKFRPDGVVPAAVFIRWANNATSWRSIWSI